MEGGRLSSLMINEAKFWQVGSGQEGKRSYSGECLKYGMAFAGERYWKGGIEKVKEGDFVVLRYSTKKIVAVGRVVEHDGEVNGCATEEKKGWLKDFDGWDLPAYCYVKWHKPYEPVDARKQLPQRAFSQLNDEEFQKQAREIFDDSHAHTSNRGGPPPTEIVADGEIGAFLNDHLVEGSEKAFSELKSIRKLAETYYNAGFRHWDEFKEHEIRTFLIVPLLRVLGWRREQIKIEVTPKKLGSQIAGSIDIVCFSDDYQPGATNENGEKCKLIIESKKFSSGLADEAVEQARGYADSLPNKCNLVLVSNGYCYKAFVRNRNKEFSEQPSAYLNLLKPKDSYPLDPRVDGALALFKLLLPSTTQ